MKAICAFCALNNILCAMILFILCIWQEDLCYQDENKTKTNIEYTLINQDNIYHFE